MPTAATDPLSSLADVIRQGLRGAPKSDGVKPLLRELFGARYAQREFKESMLRDAYALAGDNDEEGGGVPYAGLIHPDNPTSGSYGGTSIVWFPSQDAGSLIGLGVGTRGLSPDEGILTRPGHRRRIAALRRYLSARGINTWTKKDPAALTQVVPETAQRQFPGFEKVFKRYGKEMYCNAVVPEDPAKAREVVQAFFDLYAYERGWQVLKNAEPEFDQLQGALLRDLFWAPTAAEVNKLLRQRRFVILQGPPGTGKTRLCDAIRVDHFGGSGMTVQFHPAVTYEDFIVGLAPDAKSGTLRFDVRPGWLLEAVRAAKERPFLLVIDEVNRADLGKVLGEAIYLFEPSEVGGPNARTVRLPHAANGQVDLQLPTNLYVLATMNTADRSIASMDLAVRRRFAFVSLPPSREVVENSGLPLAVDVFSRVSEVFVQHAPDDALDLMPGHAYFLAKTEEELRERFRYELMPLLDEYLRLGLLGQAAHELASVRDYVDDLISAANG